MWWEPRMCAGSSPGKQLKLSEKGLGTPEVEFQEMEAEVTGV